METKDIVNKIMHSFNGTCCQERKVKRLQKEKRFNKQICNEVVERMLRMQEVQL